MLATIMLLVHALLKIPENWNFVTTFPGLFVMYRCHFSLQDILGAQSTPCQGAGTCGWCWEARQTSPLFHGLQVEWSLGNSGMNAHLGAKVVDGRMEHTSKSGLKTKCGIALLSIEVATHYILIRGLGLYQ